MNDITLSPGPRGSALLHADVVRRACLRYVQNRDEANDLAQEVLLKITTRGTGFWGGSRPTTWLYRVASNHCLDHLRREKRLRGLADSYAAESRLEAGSLFTATDSRGPEGANQATSRRVLERLREVSGETDRHVIYLRFDLGLSQSTIAEILGVSRAAVGQRLARIHSRAAYLWRDYS